MSFFEELNEFRKRILSWLFSWILFSLLLFTFPISNSFSVQLLGKIQRDLIPPGVQIIVLSPLSAFLAQVIISLFSGFILTSPLFLFEIFGFISPALYGKEKKTLLKLSIPSTLLFVLGCIFSYVFLIPATFKILYFFTLQIKAISFFELNNFLTLVFGLMVGAGIMFLLPIFMVFLTFLGVDPDFWKREFRYSLLFFLIFSAIITPDGTGITMVMLTIPLTGLYFLGYSFSKILKRSSKK